MPVSPSVANANGYNPAVFMPGLGFRVTKTEDLSGAQDDLFTVTGKVLLTMMTGEVTNALDAAITDYTLRTKTDGVPLCGTQNISSSPIGVVLTVPGAAAANLICSNPDTKIVDFGSNGLSYRRIGLSGGTLTIESAHTAGAAGDAIVWDLYYMPLEAGASVAAAA